VNRFFAKNVYRRNLLVSQVLFFLSLQERLILFLFDMFINFICSSFDVKITFTHYKMDPLGDFEGFLMNLFVVVRALWRIWKEIA